MPYDSGRLDQIRAKGSPHFTDYMPALAAGTYNNYDIHIEFDAQGCEAFDYLDTAVIRNNSSETVEFYSSPAEKWPILAGQSQTVTNRRMRSFGLKNIGSVATNADEVIVQMWKSPSSLKTVQVTQ